MKFDLVLGNVISTNHSDVQGHYWPAFGGSRLLNLQQMSKCSLSNLKNNKNTKNCKKLGGLCFVLAPGWDGGFREIVTVKLIFRSCYFQTGYF